MSDHITKIREALEAFDSAVDEVKAASWSLPAQLDAMSKADKRLAELRGITAQTDAIRSLLAALDEARQDAKRLNWLNLGATVELVPVGQNVLAFRINGQNRTISMSIRAAIDEAIAAQEGSQDA